MIAADGGVGIAQGLAQLRIAQHVPDLALHAFIEVGDLPAHDRQLDTGHVEHMAARIDAAGDALGQRAQILDGRQQSR